MYDTACPLSSPGLLSGGGRVGSLPPPARPLFHALVFTALRHVLRVRVPCSGNGTVGRAHRTCRRLPPCVAMGSLDFGFACVCAACCTLRNTTPAGSEGLPKYRGEDEEDARGRQARPVQVRHKGRTELYFLFSPLLRSPFFILPLSCMCAPDRCLLCVQLGPRRKLWRRLRLGLVSVLRCLGLR